MSFRGSTQTYSDTQLGIWLRNAQGNTLESIRNDPKVALICRWLATPLLQFHGRARIATDGVERERVFTAAREVERKADPERKGLAIIIDLTDRGRSGVWARRPDLVSDGRGRGLTKLGRKLTAAR